MQKRSRSIHTKPASQAIRPHRRSSPGLVAAEMDGSYVYFIRVDNLVKIGTTADFLRRMRIAYGPLWPTKLLHVEPGDRTDERALLVRFRPHRVAGEYHKPHAELLAYIDERRAEVHGLKPLWRKAS